MTGQLNYLIGQQQIADLRTGARQSRRARSRQRRRVAVLVAVALIAVAGPAQARPIDPNAALASSLGNCLVDPYTPASACYQAAGVLLATTAPSSCVPDPATHKLLRHPAARQRIRKGPKGDKANRIPWRR